MDRFKTFCLRTTTYDDPNAVNPYPQSILNAFWNGTVTETAGHPNMKRREDELDKLAR